MRVVSDETDAYQLGPPICGSVMSVDASLVVQGDNEFTAAATEAHILVPHQHMQLDRTESAK